MITAGKGRLVALAAVAVGATVALAGCASGNPLDNGSTGEATSETLVAIAQTLVLGAAPLETPMPQGRHHAL